MKKVYFVRHGQSIWNVENKICGATDIALTEVGQQQAIETGKAILEQGIKADEILYSPLIRAKETALRISDMTGIPAREERRLIEQNFGKYESTPRDGKEFAKAKEQFVTRYEGGESMLHLAQRIYNLLDDIKNDDKTYILVAHNGIARVVNSYFYEMTNEEYASFGVKNCEVLAYEYPMMRIPESCARCLYDKQVHRVGDPEYLARVKEIIDNRNPSDTSPYLVYQFNKIQQEMFGEPKSYSDVKRKYNDLMLGMENEIREKIESSQEPLKTALNYARVGNYIDFGAMNSIDEDEFFELLEKQEMRREDEEAYRSLVSQLDIAHTLLLITDNCGEIVLDKLFLEQIRSIYPELEITVLVRGAEVLNDATAEDASYVGLDQIARVIDNGYGIAGTIYKMLPDEARAAFDKADIIFAKGQGNYESLNGEGHHIFYSFLCKCDLFTGRFEVPKFTGILYEEN